MGRNNLFADAVLFCYSALHSCREPISCTGSGLVTYQDTITIEPGKRGGRPTIRGTRITVADVLGWLAAGMTYAQIVSDYQEITEAHIRACLAYAADRERRLVTTAK
jgi:uncharacterized protein (DUF433 family)